MSDLLRAEDDLRVEFAASPTRAGLAVDDRTVASLVNENVGHAGAKATTIATRIDVAGRISRSRLRHARWGAGL